MPPRSGLSSLTAPSTSVTGSDIAANIRRPVSWSVVDPGCGLAPGLAAARGELLTRRNSPREQVPTTEIVVEITETKRDPVQTQLRTGGPAAVALSKGRGHVEIGASVCEDGLQQTTGGLAVVGSTWRWGGGRSVEDGGPWR